MTHNHIFESATEQNNMFLLLPLHGTWWCKSITDEINVDVCEKRPWLVLTENLSVIHMIVMLDPITNQCH